jgi:CO/xanthine dehydrogenase Mo-binding subunit
VGGLVIAISLPACKPSHELTGDQDHRANAWLRIGTDDSITFLCDRSEMGQGVFTSLPMLIAEELGRRLERIKVEFAPPATIHQQHDRRPDHRRQHQHARRLGKAAHAPAPPRATCW